MDETKEIRLYIHIYIYMYIHVYIYMYTGLNAVTY